MRFQVVSDAGSVIKTFDTRDAPDAEERARLMITHGGHHTARVRCVRNDWDPLTLEDRVRALEAIVLGKS